MPIQLLCPYCQTPARLLSVLSSVSQTDFYACDSCAKVSERSKGDTGSPVAISARHSPIPAAPLVPVGALAQPAAVVPLQRWRRQL
ncbi:MAG: hypothetical protein ABUS56_09705 [Acidobacteriota bacterium]